jgi:apolipoprotein N-acyltransferase
VPFGEFLPFENILKKIGLKSLTNNYQSYSSGNKREIINIGLNGSELNFLPLICYELIYSGELSRNNNFNYIINISEDGWFGNSIGPHQHFTHAIFRSIENGKYLIRSANNGISAVINPIGKVISKMNLNETGKLVFEHNKNQEKTIFLLFGNKIIIFVILIYILLIFSFNRLKNE